MATDGDYYRLLGVPRHASTPEIRRAYRRLARRHHPDRNRRPDGPERFRALADAYAVLNDPARRARYDHDTAAPQPPPIPPTRPARVSLRGVVELSAREAQLAATGRLTLTSHHGITIALPADVHDGDQVTVHVGPETAVLTVRVLPT